MRPGPTVQFQVTAEGTPPLTYQWLYNGQPIRNGLVPASLPVFSGANTATLTLTNVQARLAGAYSVIISNAAGKATSAPALLRVNGSATPDRIKPTVAISQPAPNIVSTQAAYVQVRGTASDSGGLAAVLVAVDTPGVLGEFSPARGTTNWTFRVPLEIEATSVFRVKAVDRAGNESPTLTRGYVQSMATGIDLATNGSGTIKGLTNGQTLDSETLYTVRAIPAPGNLFSNWVQTSGSLLPRSTIHTNSTLRFRPGRNPVLTANFTTNRFLALKGAYRGLFTGAGGGTNHETSGGFAFDLTGAGAFSGTARWRGLTLQFSGQFGLDLTARTLARTGTNTLALLLALAVDGSLLQVTGLVTQTDFQSPLAGYAVAFAAARPATNFAGLYTALLFANPIEAPDTFGQGIASLVVSRPGLVTLNATLPDGTVISPGVPLGALGQAALYVPLAGGKGSIFGWMQFTNGADTDVATDLWWTKKSGLPGAIYPRGFTNQVSALGSRYAPPGPGTNAFGFLEGAVILAGGGLNAGTLDIPVTVVPTNKITATPPNTNKLALALQPVTGRFTGSFLNPDTRKTNIIRGVVLPRQALGGGFFLNTNQSGTVFLGQ